MKVYQNNYEILPFIQNQLNELLNLKNEIQKEQQILPQGKIRISISHKSYQFFHITNKKQRLGKYISKRKNINLIYQLAQKRYNQELLTEINKEIKILQKFIKQYKPEKICTTFNSQHPALKNYITNYSTTKEIFIKNWLQINTPVNNISPENLKFTTSFGLKVRSKSEVMIAEALNNHKIPFRYEYPIELNSCGIIHPDFYCLNPRTLNEIIWEHFGMMDDKDYANKAIKKINSYQKSDFIPGKNFCFTQETSVYPLDMKQIYFVIKSYLA